MRHTFEQYFHVEYFLKVCTLHMPLLLALLQVFLLFLLHIFIVFTIFMENPNFIQFFISILRFDFSFGLKQILHFVVLLDFLAFLIIKLERNGV